MPSKSDCQTTLWRKSQQSAPTVRSRIVSPGRFASDDPRNCGDFLLFEPSVPLWFAKHRRPHKYRWEAPHREFRYKTRVRDLQSARFGFAVLSDRNPNSGKSKRRCGASWSEWTDRPGAVTIRNLSPTGSVRTKNFDTRRIMVGETLAARSSELEEVDAWCR
jgi:hypothetical protein